MVGGPPDWVDCERLALDRETLERVYELGTLPRLRDLLANGRGQLRARFEFRALESGRSGAVVAVDAAPQLVCQRCMDGFEFRVVSRSEIEFASESEATDADAGGEREVCRSDQGMVSLSDLAEEELLLALPLAPACAAPSTCGKAPARYREAGPGEAPPAAAETVRPFGALRDLMKKQDRT